MKKKVLIIVLSAIIVVAIGVFAGIKIAVIYRIIMIKQENINRIWNMF